MYRFPMLSEGPRWPSEPSPAPIEEPRDSPESPDIPVREPDPDTPNDI